MPSVRIALHVTPKSSRDEIAGWRGGELSVRVTSVPEGGKANATACKTIATALGVPKTAVRVVRGQKSRHKQAEIEGVTQAQVDDVFGKPAEGLF